MSDTPRGPTRAEMDPTPRTDAMIAELEAELGDGPPNISPAAIDVIVRLRLIAHARQLERGSNAVPDAPEGYRYELVKIGAAVHVAPSATTRRDIPGMKWQLVEDMPPLTGGEHPEVVGGLFGVRFVDGCSNGCAELYVEDDGNWHFKMRFDRAWLKDLAAVANRAAESTATRNSTDSGRKE